MPATPSYIVMVGGGSVNTTHLMLFQEWSRGATTNTGGIIIPKEKSHKLFYEDIAIQAKPVDKK